MKDTFYSTEKKVIAIIFCDPADPYSGKTALKYSYVDNKPDSGGVSKFAEFARTFKTARYINFYSREDGSYLGRVYLVVN